VNVVSIQPLLWQVATAWFMEASYVSSRSESRGLPKRADSMGYADNYEPNSVDAFAQDPSTVVPLWRRRRSSWRLGQDDHHAREPALGDARQAHRRLLIEARRDDLLTTDGSAWVSAGANRVACVDSHV
jgi:hypothetical protein